MVANVFIDAFEKLRYPTKPFAILGIHISALRIIYGYINAHVVDSACDPFLGLSGWRNEYFINKIE
jgi:hypothetical protein